ncbi:hypothetical protein FNH73_15755 [Salmonella enterica subsp. salamae]|nr:hypothetical protein [Salmonella enterica subsp. salamae]
MKKYELVTELSREFLGRKLFRIRALISFGDVEAGDLGGWIEKEDSLDHSGNAWVSGDAWVSGSAHYITVGPIGSGGGTLTAFRQADNSILVTRGCFRGTIEEFAEAVIDRHGETHYAEEYGIVIQLIETRLAEID